MKGERSMVERAQPRSYYDQPVIKEPAWTFEVPWYFFAGGLAGASAPLALAARLTGNTALAQAARRAALAGAVASPVLLVSDLGRPERFLNMLRVFKVTSPLSVGSWLLSAFAPAAAAAAVLAEVGRLPRAQALAEWAAAALGPAMTTYTAVLVADTAVPAWHEARHQLPFAFAGSAAASAGAVGAIVSSDDDAAPARRLALIGAVLELGTTEIMERRLGDLAEPYGEGKAGRWSKAAKVVTVAGAALLAAGGRRVALRRAGGALLLAGSLAERHAVFNAGFQSARDPRYTVAPQRDRLGWARA